MFDDKLLLWLSVALGAFVIGYSLYLLHFILS